MIARDRQRVRDVDAGELAPALELLARRHFVVLASLAESAMSAALHAPVNTLDDARYVTGNTLFVDGGGHINGVSWAPTLPD